MQELQFAVTRTSEIDDQHFLRSPKISLRRCRTCDVDKDLLYIWKYVWLENTLGGNSDRIPLAFVLMV
jgi:hypothetical protein